VVGHTPILPQDGDRCQDEAMSVMVSLFDARRTRTREKYTA